MKTYLEYLTEAATEKGWLPLAVLEHFDMPEAGEIFNRAAEMYAETKHLHKPVVVRGGDKEKQSIPRAVDYVEFMKEQYTPNTPTEPLESEGEEKCVCGDCGVPLTLVRPGKHQCDNELCKSNRA